MQTLVLRIGAPPQPGDPFPLELFHSPSDDPSALQKVAGAAIPPTLEPTSPTLDVNGNALTVPSLTDSYGAISGNSPDVTAIGDFLYKLVVRGDIKTEWQRIQAAAGAESIRILLDIDDGDGSEVLPALPWELLYERKTGSQLFLEQLNTVARGRTATIAQNDDWPLRVVVILGVDPASPLLGAVGANEELRALEKLFAASRFDVEYQLLEYPTTSEIAAACEGISPHILHFIGHGRSAAAGAELLIYRNKTFNTWALGDIRRDIRSGGHAPRLVFLNACRTSVGTGVPNAGGPLMANLTDVLFAIGTKAVIGMQGDVPGDLAARFSAEFYKQVLEQAPLDVAMTAARREMSRGRGQLEQRVEWSLPVLNTAILPSLVLPQRTLAPLVGPERFVDRVQQRRLVHDSMRASAPAPNGTMSPYVVAIVGDEGAGKTHLARWCQQAFEWRGSQTVYVDFDTPDTIDVFEALRWIRDGERPPKRRQPGRVVPNWGLPAEAFRQFNWEINHRQAGLTIVPPLPDDAAPILDDLIPFADSARPPENFIGDTFAQFRAALEHIAQQKDLVLVLDHLQQLEAASLSKWMVEHFIKPVAEGRVKRVRLVLVSPRRKGTLDIDGLLSGMRPSPTLVNVDYFRKEDFDRLSRLLCLQWSEEIYVKLTSQLTLLRDKFATGPWKAQVFATINKMCDAWHGVLG